MLNIAVSLAGDQESGKSFNFDISGFWKAAKLSNYSSIYLGAFTIVGIILGGQYLVSASFNKPPMISSDTASQIIMIFIWMMPFFLITEVAMRVFDTYSKNKK